jgi:hypothetical protein
MKKLLGAICALFFTTFAFGQTFGVQNLQVNGSATISVPSAFTSAALRAALGAAPTINVDNVNGVDWSGCGTGAGSAACKSIQTAYNNLCSQFDMRSIFPASPVIKLTSGQTFTTGLTIQQGAQTSPTCTGANQLTLDLNGATINPTNNTAIYIRHVPIWLRVKSSSGQGTLTVSGTQGNLVDARGGGVMVEFDGGINFGSTPGTYPQLSASRSAIISTCPVGTCPESINYNITGGGGTFASAIIGGSIQFEGITLNIANAVTYQVAFTQADDAGSSSNWSGMTWQCAGTTCTGSGSVTGAQYIASKAGVVNTNAQAGPFSGCAGNNMLPGNACGQMGYTGGRFSDPGTPIVSGCGTGAFAQNSEPAFNIVLGSGLTTTNGTRVSSCNVTMATRSAWNACTLVTNDPGSVSALGQAWTGPTSSAPGVLNITWTATGFDPNGKAIWVNCGS